MGMDHGNQADADLIAAGWAGVMSLPRVLSLNPENELEMCVAPAAKQLRAAHSGIAQESSSAAREKQLEGILLHDLAAEVELEIRPKGDDFRIQLQSDTKENFVTISCMKASGGRELRVDNVSAPVAGAAESPLRLHLFLDGSVLEVFINGTTTVTKRVYRIPSGPLRVKLEGNAELLSFDAWQMNPISKDRLTDSLCR
jgi:beta-fructofuranosidase